MVLRQLLDKGESKATLKQQSLEEADWGYCHNRFTYG